MKKMMIVAATIVFSFVTWACGCSEAENIEQQGAQNQTIFGQEELQSNQAETPKQPETTEAIKVRDVVGKSLDNAKVVLKSQGFEVYVEEEYSNDIEEGYVISQSPSVENDLSLSMGDVITLIVSKGKEPIVAQYLDSTVYADFVTGSPYNKMSAYSGKDRFGNECTRAIKFECNGDEEKHDDGEQIHQTFKVTYSVKDGVEKFSCVLAPGIFLYNLNYIHVNLYKDEEIIYSMDISEDTKPLELSYDIAGVDTFTIELTYLLCDSPYEDSASIIFSEAKFE